MTRRANVLVVDDDPKGREATAVLLEMMGYATTTTASGDEALRYIYSEESCDVVFSEVMMPGMHGLELARRCQDARPGLAVILFSGSVDGVATAMAAGTLALTKPITRSRMERVLERALASVLPRMEQESHSLPQSERVRGVVRVFVCGAH